MKYFYYPGCSLEGTASEYDFSTRALMSAVGAELAEVEGWTCCGASAASATSFLLSLVLPARNLALAEKMNKSGDMLVPCSACYLNLKNAAEKAGKDAGLFRKINHILAEDHLEFGSKVRVKHLLEVLARDIGAEKIRASVKKTFPGIVIAPYYGCQAIRPYAVFDDPECPKSMEPLIEAIGAEVHRWDMGGKCCGAGNMTTKPEFGIRLVSAILKKAKGADAIVTVCPMCQMNLEAFQGKASEYRHEDLHIPVLYLPQLLGLAIGLTEKELRLDSNLSELTGFLKKSEAAHHGSIHS